jgi:ribosomal protein L40E
MLSGGTIKAGASHFSRLDTEETVHSFSSSAGLVAQDSHGMNAPLPTQPGHMLEMSPLPYLQCLFCNHLNPAGASFCNNCGSELHLQPCDRCGALNKRTEKGCHKCGASFTLPAASARNGSVPALTEVEPANLPPGQGAAATQNKPARLSRRTLQLAALTLLFVAIVMSGEYYSEQSAEFTKTQGVIPFAPRVSGLPMATTVPPPPVATLAEEAPARPDTTPKPAAVTATPTETASPAPAAAGATLSVRTSAANQAAAIKHRDPALLKECPDSVAALGICSSSSSSKNEEQ